MIQLQKHKVILSRALTYVSLALFVVVGFASIWSSINQKVAYAATNNTINFQARLLSSTGALVADGSYNVTFNMYNISAGGAAEWSETDTVNVKNGYITVSLGAGNPFSNASPAIKWDQQQWLTMNVNGDGEMNPRMKVTSVPYAMAAGTLQTTGASFTSTLAVSSPTVGDQIFQIQDQGVAGTYNLCIQNSAACGFAPISGGGNYVQLQASSPGSAQTGNLNISGTAIAGTSLLTPTLDVATAGTLSVGNTTATAITLGSSGITTTNAGALTVSQLLTANSGLRVTGSSSVATVGISNLLTADGTFATSSGWSAGGVVLPSGGWNITTPTAGAANHAVGYTTSLYGTSNATDTSTVYQINFDVNVTNPPTDGGFMVSLGGTDSSNNFTTSGSKTIYIRPGTNTGFLRFTLHSVGDFGGTIDNVTIHAIATSTADIAVVSSDGTSTPLEVRAGGNGLYNSFVGLQTGYTNTTGNYNSAIGAYALQLNATGYDNTAMGYGSLQVNTTGYDNTAMGMGSLHSNIIGRQNAAIGVYSLYSNTVGYDNTAMGMYSLGSNTVGSNNTAIGYRSLYYNTGGINNSAIGLDAGRFISNGSTANQTSSNSVYLGYGTMAKANGDTNETVIGYNAIGAGNNSVVLGNSSVNTTTLQGYVGIGSTTTPGAALLEADQVTTGMGTVTVTGTTTVTGTGTHFLNTFKVGDSITITSTGETKLISDIASDTSMTIAAATDTIDSAYTLVGGARFSVLGNGNVGIGETTPLALLTVGSGDLFQVNSSGAIAAAVGITSAGAAISLNANSNFDTNINTGTSTGAVTIGGGSAPLTIDSTAFDVTSAGALSGITTISLSGAITGATATDTINGLIINSGALSGISTIDTSSTINSQTISSSANLTGTLAVNGASVTVGTASATDGAVVLQNSANAYTITITGANKTDNSSIISFPHDTGASDMFCLATLNNCAGQGVPTSRSLTINGTTQDLSADRTWTVGDMTLAGVESVTGAKTFDKDKILMKGTNTGVTTISTANTSANDYIATLQAADGTIAYQGDTTYIGTTSIALNRASAAQALTGITSIDGSAASLTTSRNIQGVAFNGTGNIDIINGTGFVKATGTSLSYDNSTYLTAEADTLATVTGRGATTNTASSFTGGLTANTLTVNGASISGTNSGDVTIGAFGSTPNANGLSLSTQAITLQPANGSNPGAVSTTTQTFAGAKTFSSLLTGSAGLSITSGTLSVTSDNATGTTTSGALNLSANSLTTGTGLYVASSSLTTGKLIDLQVSGTAAGASQTALNILTTGATASNAITTYGGYISNTHTNGTSGTNVALYLNASGATTANYGLIVAAGNVGIGNSAPSSRLMVTGSGSVGTVGSTEQLYANNPSTYGNFSSSTGWSAGGSLPRGNWSIATGAPSTSCDAGALISYCAAHTGGAITPLSGASNATSTSTVYQITFNIGVASTPGSGFTVSLGGTTASMDTGTYPNNTVTTSFSTVGSYTVYVKPGTATGTLAFTPAGTGDFVGTIYNVTIYAITTSTADISVVSSDNTSTPLEVRAGGSGLNNSFVGFQAGYNVASYGTIYGNDNSAMGYQALQYNTVGYNNTAMGYQALQANTTGYSNTAMGTSALQANTIGYNNMAMGYLALQANTTGYGNSAVGALALQANTTGNYNMAMGNRALYANTIGGYNMAIGSNALYTLNGGQFNTAVGAQALYSATNSSNNTAAGFQALYYNTTGANNTAIGEYAGMYISGYVVNESPVTHKNQTSGNSVYLGYSTQAQASGDTNETVIGYNAIGAGNNSVVLGNSSVNTTTLQGYVGIGSTTTPGAALLQANQVTTGMGTVTVTGTTTVTGTGTHFLNTFKVGDSIIITATGETKAISAIASDTSMTIAAATNTAGSAYTLAGGVRLAVLGNGNVGIGTLTPSYKLTVNGEPGANGYTAFTNYSDARLKTNISSLGSGYLSKILALNPSTFNYNSLTGYDDATLSRTITGFIAQDLQTVFPDMVGSTTINGVEYLDTNLSSLPIYTIKAIQEQQGIINAQGSSISTLEVTSSNTDASLMALQNDVTAYKNTVQNGVLTIDGANIQGDANIGSLNVSGPSTLASLSVNGNITSQNIAVTGTATLRILKVTGPAEFGGDLNLVASVNTKQAITKKFLASGPIAAGSVVIIDPTKDGHVTTTANAQDTKIIGVAVDEAINAGDEIKVAIGGSVQVGVDQFTAVASGDMIVSDSVAGKAKADTNPKVGSILGKATSAKDVNNLVWVLITLQ